MSVLRFEPGSASLPRSKIVSAAPLCRPSQQSLGSQASHMQALNLGAVMPIAGLLCREVAQLRRGPVEMEKSFAEVTVITC